MADALILVNMPFAGIQFPSIQLGLLQALARSASIQCNSIYANIAFARRINPALYRVLSDHRGPMVGEWIFALAAFGDEVAEYTEIFLRDFPDAFSEIEEKTNVSAQQIQLLRTDIAPAFIAELAEEIVKRKPRVVGFTSTFEQNSASIALARAIKQKDPSIATLFGGANFDEPMGAAYTKAIPWIDVCVIGEADTVFVPLVQAMVEHRTVPKLRGVLTRERLYEIKAVGRSSYEASMDKLPPPSYDDYFQALLNCGITDVELGRPIFLPFESSRGCWWGEKHHCTFCGLNALGMKFREKTPDKVVQEISYLTKRHNINRFAAVDNILSPALAKGLDDRLVGGQYDYEFFYEIKANLTREKLRNLYNLGIRHVQPGIESLSTHVLKLMRKGITATQNLNALRWMNYYGFEVLWNIIYGFPGETEADYERQLKIIEQISHLVPPVGVGRIWLERFSPIYKESAAFGFADIRPASSYAYVYPRSVDLNNAAYFFEGHSPDTVSDSSMNSTHEAVARWREKWTMEILPYLIFVRTHAGVSIIDGRDTPNSPVNVTYRSPADAIYLFCSDHPRTTHSMAQYLRECLDIDIDDASLTAILERFVTRGFMLAEDNLYLSLALPANRYA